jgi:hypothetical protein
MQLALLPVVVLDQALEHAGGLDAEDELRVGLELAGARPSGDRVGAAAEARAVDAQRLAGLAVAVDDDERPATSPPFSSGTKPSCSRLTPKKASTSSITVSDSGCSLKRASPQFFET